MRPKVEELLKKALTLSVEERADLAGSLIESLDESKDESVSTLWDEEIARRMEEIDSGKVRLIPWEDARRKLSSQ